MTKWQWLVLGFGAGMMLNCLAFMAVAFGKRLTMTFSPITLTIWGLIGAVFGFIGYFIWHI